MESRVEVLLLREKNGKAPDAEEVAYMCGLILEF